jgi:hypothetical protein
MGFFGLLWNLTMMLIKFFGVILIEICIFGLVFIAISPTIGEFWTNALGIIFVIWIIVDSILKIVVGGSASILRYVWSFTQ